MLSLRLGTRGLELARQQNDLEYEGKFLHVVGRSHWRLNDYARALECFEEGLRIANDIGDKSVAEFNSGGLGLVYSNQANYHKALRYFYQAWRLSQETNNVEWQPSWLSDVAGVYKKLGDYDKAIELYEKAIAQAQRTSGETLVLYLVGAIATAYKGKGDFVKALEYYESGVRIQTSEFQSEWLIDMGVIYQALGQQDEAFEAYAKARQINKEFGYPRIEAIALNQLGRLYGDLSEFDLSTAYLEQALEIGQTIAEPPIVWESYVGLASNLEKQVRLEQSMHYYALAISEIDKVRSQLYSENYRAEFIVRHLEIYEKFINLLLRLHDENPDKGYDRRAFNYAQERTASSMLDMLANNARLVSKGIDEAALARKSSIEKELQKIQSSISKEVSKDNLDQRILDSLHVELTKIRNRHEEIREEILTNYPAYASLTGEAVTLTIEEIQEKVLADDQVLLQYLLCEKESFLFILDKHSMTVERIGAPRVNIEKKIVELTKPLRETASLTNIKFDLELARELYDILVAPASKFLQKRQHLLIIPDGILYYLPFEALVTDVNQGTTKKDIWYASYGDAEYLIERNPISYVPSVSVLQHLNKRQMTKQSDVELLAFGNPNYYSISEDEKQLLSSLDWNFSPLRYSMDEISGIGKLFKNRRLLLGAEATEENVKSLSQNSNILHFSVHGLLDARQPLYSALVLSQDQDETEDGFLQAYEIYNLDLNADLVTLSACETGLGRLQRGEGIIGLTRAFMYAGARSVMLSLWKVHDESTTEFMTAFYQNWRKKGVSHVEALRYTKLQLMKKTAEMDGQKISYAHPFFWAPFVITGQPDLRLQSKSEMVDYTWQLIGLLVLVVGSAALLIKRRSVEN